MDYKELKKIADASGIITQKNGKPRSGEDIYLELIYKKVIPTELSDEDYHNVSLGHFGYYTTNVDPIVSKDVEEPKPRFNFTTSQLIMQSAKYLEDLFEKTSDFEIESLVFYKDKEKTVTISLGENVLMLKGDSKIPSDWHIIYAGPKGGIK